ncbi:MAG: orotidine-5'-phosphate decarboxylase [Candidatus Eremiobacteraeota bacterium]|nr:orotidine-5'-phosphate decarboxylase [Candidatus Eremiobacteraeota bacterium]
MNAPELIVALDVPAFEDARRVLDALDGLPIVYKVGFEAFCAYGDAIRDEIEQRRQTYFLDIKLHDIPNTVARAIRAVVRPGARIIDVHALGGSEMMQAAVEASEQRAAELGIDPPEIFAVTILTSIAPEDLRELGLTGGPGENAIRLAALARDARCSGVICSPQEVRDLKSFFGTDFKTLTPGIRPAESPHGDQKRVMTPREAREAGTDYIVVGRPILESADMRATAQAILRDLVPA